MTDPGDDDGKYVILDLVNDAIVALSNPVQVSARELLTSGWAGIIRQGFDPLEDSSDVLLRGGAKILRHGFLEEQAISCHALSDRRGGPRR